MIPNFFHGSGWRRQKCSHTFDWGCLDFLSAEWFGFWRLCDGAFTYIDGAISLTNKHTASRSSCFLYVIDDQLWKKWKLRWFCVESSGSGSLLKATRRWSLWLSETSILTPRVVVMDLECSLGYFDTVNSSAPSVSTVPYPNHDAEYTSQFIRFLLFV